MSDFWKKVGTTISGIGSAASSLSNVAGLASSVSGIFGSLIQGRQQRNLLKYQDQLADENYQQQLKDQWAMYERQFSDQKSMIDAQNQYNSYSSVRKRAEQAGINPLAAITGQTGGIGIQAQAGNTPSASTPSGYTGTSALSDIGVGHLITGGASLMAQSRENMMFEENLRALKQENDLREIELKWRDKQYAQDYEKNEVYIALQEAHTAESKVNARYTTSMIELNDQLKDFNEQLNPIKLTEAETSLQLMREQLFQMEFKTDTQREAFEMSMAESRANIKQMLGNLELRAKELEQRAQEFGLSKEQLAEVKRANNVLEKYRDRVQDFDEKSRNREFTRDTIIQGIDAYMDVLTGTSKIVGGVLGGLLKL